MTKQVNVYEAKTHFSKLLTWVQAGEEVIIARAGRPVARLIPVGERPARRLPGSGKGKIVVAADFDSPLPEAVLEMFQG